MGIYTIIFQSSGNVFKLLSILLHLSFIIATAYFDASKMHVRISFLKLLLAALWSDMYKLKLDIQNQDVYDCRLRPWYVSAGGAPRDVLILVDASGSMHNSSNQVISEQFTSTLLNALTDDDQVNVLRFHVDIESPISCFNEKLVPVSLIFDNNLQYIIKFRIS